MREDLFVIIRSVGERTEECLKTRLLQEISEDNILVVSEKSLSATLKKAFSLAIEQGKEWTLNIDADVLLLPNAIQGIMKRVRDLTPNVFAAHFLVADALMGDIRYAGNEIYRTRYLPLALPFVEESFTKLRPVRHVISCMEEKGYLFNDHREEIIGIHDALQYFKDIYRKAFVFSFKHLNKASEFLPYWRKKALHELEFFVAIKGFADGVQHLDPIEINMHFFEERKNALNEWFLEKHIEERKSLSLITDHEILFLLNNILKDHYAMSHEKKVYRWIHQKDFR